MDDESRRMRPLLMQTPRLQSGCIAHDCATEKPYGTAFQPRLSLLFCPVGSTRNPSSCDQSMFSNQLKSSPKELRADTAGSDPAGCMSMDWVSFSDRGVMLMFSGV